MFIEDDVPGGARIRALGTRLDLDLAEVPAGFPVLLHETCPLDGTGAPGRTICAIVRPVSTSTQ